MSENLEPTVEQDQVPNFNQGPNLDTTDEEEKKPSKWRGSQVLFVLMGLGLAGTYFMYIKTGPKTAAAEAHVVAAQSTVTSFLSKGPANVKLMEKMLKSTEKVIQQFLKYPAVTQVALEDLKTNPFRQSEVKNKADGVDEAAAAKLKEAQRQAALSAVQNLNLQSVMVSDRNRSCMINNALYLEGQQVDQFNIERIAPGSVVVRYGQYRFELQMNQ